MKYLILIFIFIGINGKSCFTVKNVSLAKATAIESLKEQNHYISTHDLDDIFIENIIDLQFLSNDKNGVYRLSSNVVHSNDLLLYKNGNNYELYYSTPSLSDYYDSLFKLEVTLSEKRDYLKQILKHYKHHLKVSSQKKITIIPNDSEVNVQKNRTIDLKKNLNDAEQVYLEYLSKLND